MFFVLRCFGVFFFFYLCMWLFVNNFLFKVIYVCVVCERYLLLCVIQVICYCIFGFISCIVCSWLVVRWWMKGLGSSVVFMLVRVMVISQFYWVFWVMILGWMFNFLNMLCRLWVRLNLLLSSISGMLLSWVQCRVVWFFWKWLVWVMVYMGQCVIGRVCNFSFGLVGRIVMLIFSLLLVMCFLICGLVFFFRMMVILGWCLWKVFSIGVQRMLIMGGMLIFRWLQCSVLVLCILVFRCCIEVRICWFCLYIMCLVLVSCRWWLLCINSGVLILFFSWCIILLMVDWVMCKVLVVWLKLVRWIVLVKQCRVWMFMVVVFGGVLGWQGSMYFLIGMVEF